MKLELKGAAVLSMGCYTYSHNFCKFKICIKENHFDLQGTVTFFKITIFLEIKMTVGICFGTLNWIDLLIHTLCDEYFFQRETTNLNNWIGLDMAN